MFNTNFDKEAFRKAAEKSGMIRGEIDAFTSAISLRLRPEETRVPKDFYDIKRVIDHIATKKSLSERQAIGVLLNRPSYYFDFNGIEMESSYAKESVPKAPATVSPMLRMLANRGRRDNQKRTTFSAATIEMLSVPPNDRIPPGHKRVHDYGDPVEPEPVPKKTAIPKTRAWEERNKPASYHPTFQEIADAARAYYAVHGRYPNGGLGTDFLPAGSVTWGTLLVQKLYGENTIAKLLQKYPSHEKDDQQVVEEETTPFTETPSLEPTFSKQATPAPARTAGKKSSKGTTMPTDEQIAEAAWKYEEKYKKTPRYASGHEFLPKGSQSWSTLNIHYLKGAHSLSAILAAHPKKNFEQVLIEFRKTLQNGSTQLAGPSVPTVNEPVQAPAPALKKAFNPVSAFQIQTSEKDIEEDLARLGPQKLAVLVAARIAVKDKGDHANIIYQSAAERVLTIMFGDKMISEEDFEARQKEFSELLCAHMIDLVMGRQSLSLRPLRAPQSEFILAAPAVA